jgi:hypothetical protein
LSRILGKLISQNWIVVQSVKAGGFGRNITIARPPFPDRRRTGPQHVVEDVDPANERRKAKRTSFIRRRWPLALRAGAPYGGRAGRFDSPVADLDDSSMARLPLLGADGYMKDMRTRA